MVLVFVMAICAAFSANFSIRDGVYQGSKVTFGIYEIQFDSGINLTETTSWCFAPHTGPLATYDFSNDTCVPSGCSTTNWTVFELNKPIVRDPAPPVSYYRFYHNNPQQGLKIRVITKSFGLVNIFVSTSEPEPTADNCDFFGADTFFGESVIICPDQPGFQLGTFYLAVIANDVGVEVGWTLFVETYDIIAPPLPCSGNNNVTEILDEVNLKDGCVVYSDLPQRSGTLLDYYVFDPFSNEQSVYDGLCKYVSLSVWSLIGDADLYVSSETAKPSWLINEWNGIQLGPDSLDFWFCYNSLRQSTSLPTLNCTNCGWITWWSGISRPSLSNKIYIGVNLYQPGAYRLIATTKASKLSYDFNSERITPYHYYRLSYNSAEMECPGYSNFRCINRASSCSKFWPAWPSTDPIPTWPFVPPFFSSSSSFNFLDSASATSYRGDIGEAVTGKWASVVLAYYRSPALDVRNNIAVEDLGKCVVKFQGGLTLSDGTPIVGRYAFSPDNKTCSYTDLHELIDVRIQSIYKRAEGIRDPFVLSTLQKELDEIFLSGTWQRCISFVKDLIGDAPQNISVLARVCKETDDPLTSPCCNVQAQFEDSCCPEREDELIVDLLSRDIDNSRLNVCTNLDCASSKAHDLAQGYYSANTECDNIGTEKSRILSLYRQCRQVSSYESEIAQVICFESALNGLESTILREFIGSNQSLVEYLTTIDCQTRIGQSSLFYPATGRSQYRLMDSNPTCLLPSCYNYACLDRTCPFTAACNKEIQECAHILKYVPGSEETCIADLVCNDGSDCSNNNTFFCGYCNGVTCVDTGLNETECSTGICLLANGTFISANASICNSYYSCTNDCPNCSNDNSSCIGKCDYTKSQISFGNNLGFCLGNLPFNNKPEITVSYSTVTIFCDDPAITTNVGCVFPTSNITECLTFGGQWIPTITEDQCNNAGIRCLALDEFTIPTTRSPYACIACGNEVVSMFDWIPGNWVPGKIVGGQWMRRQLIPRNEWTTAINFTKFAQVADALYSSIQVINSLSSIQCKVGKVSEPLKYMACGCSESPDSSCYNDLETSSVSVIQTFILCNSLESIANVQNSCNIHFYDDSYNSAICSIVTLELRYATGFRSERRNFFSPIKIPGAAPEYPIYNNRGIAAGTLLSDGFTLNGMRVDSYGTLCLRQSIPYPLEFDDVVDIAILNGTTPTPLFKNDEIVYDHDTGFYCVNITYQNNITYFLMSRVEDFENYFDELEISQKSAAWILTSLYIVLLGLVIVFNIIFKLLSSFNPLRFVSGFWGALAVFRIIFFSTITTSQGLLFLNRNPGLFFILLNLPIFFAISSGSCMAITWLVFLKQKSFAKIFLITNFIMYTIFVTFAIAFFTIPLPSDVNSNICIITTGSGTDVIKTLNLVFAIFIILISVVAATGYIVITVKIGRIIGHSTKGYLYKLFIAFTSANTFSFVVISCFVLTVAVRNLEITESLVIFGIVDIIPGVLIEILITLFNIERMKKFKSRSSITRTTNSYSETKMSTDTSYSE